MDIVKTAEKKSKSKRVLWLGGAVALLTGIASLSWWDNAQLPQLAEESLLSADVQRGELTITVRGTGVLQPKEVRLISSQVEGRVEQLFHKAGALVKQGEPLLKLSNPALEQQLSESQWQLEAFSAEVDANKVLLESALLDQQAATMNEKLNYQQALLTFEAQQVLLDQGNATVSEIEYKQSEIEVSRFEQRHELEQQRYAKRQQSLEAQLLSDQANLNRLQKIVAHLRQQVEGLTVTASMDSIVQNMPLELGERVEAGQTLARIADGSRYIAQLRIPEKLIKDISLGLAVTIDTRNNLLEGTVQRIDPSVTNSTVQVDVELIGKLPQEVRPDLTVEGEIMVANLDDVLYVKRPMYVQSFSQQAVFVVENGTGRAHQQNVQFGQASAQHIVVTSGLERGDTLVISDTSNWQQHAEIMIN